MNVGEACSRVVIHVTSDDSVRRAAELMRKYHVGFLVVTEHGDERQVPVGTLTDRDIVLETVAPGIDPGDITVGDIMDQDAPLVVHEADRLPQVLDAMREQGVRRVPVVDARRSLVGVLSLDDILQHLGMQLSIVAEVVGDQRRNESKARA